MGAHGRRRPQLARGAARRAGRCAPIDLDCNHIPDAAMTLAVMALYADGPTHAAQHRQLARQGNRPPRRDGRPSCASSAPTVEEGADFLRDRRRPRAWRAAAHRTPTTTTAWRCASSLAAFNRAPAPAAAGAHPRPAAASARPSPTISRRCSPVAAAPRAAHPGDRVDGPTRLRQGHARQRRRAPRSATTTSTPARCTASPRWPRCSRAGARRRRRARASPAWPRALTCASPAAASLLGGARRHRRDPHARRSA